MSSSEATLPEKHKSTRSARAKRAALTRKKDRIFYDYSAKFPGWSGWITPAVERAMERALKTGKDQPLLIEERKEIERSAAEYDAKLAAEHAQPFTAELEKHYTARVKNRKLIEGDCERPWQNYFAFREANTCEPLTADDVRYLSQWTTCPIPPIKSRHLKQRGFPNAAQRNLSRPRVVR